MRENRLPVSILIPTMNRPKALRRTLDGYLKGEYIPSQIVVVDQSQTSTDREEIRCLLQQYKNITEIVYVYQNMPSLTKARNTAFIYAKEEIIVCSDDDIDVKRDTIKNVYTLMKDPCLAMIAGIDDNVNPKSSKIGYLLGTKSFFNRKIGHVTYSMLGRFPDKFSESANTMWAMGFFFIIRKSLKEKWKLEWDEKLPGYAYAEDLDFSYSYYKKASANQLSCIMSSSVCVKHLASQEYRTSSRKGTFMYVLNRAYLSYKHNMGWKSELAMRWCNFWIYMGRILKNDCPQDMWDAMKYLSNHRNEVRIGKFNY